MIALTALALVFLWQKPGRARDDRLNRPCPWAGRYTYEINSRNTVFLILYCCSLKYARRNLLTKTK